MSLYSRGNIPVVKLLIRLGQGESGLFDPISDGVGGHLVLFAHLGGGEMFLYNLHVQTYPTHPLQKVQKRT